MRRTGARVEGVYASMFSHPVDEYLFRYKNNHLNASTKLFQEMDHQVEGRTAATLPLDAGQLEDQEGLTDLEKKAVVTSFGVLQRDLKGHGVHFFCS